MNDDVKEQLRYILSLLKMCIKANRLSVATDDKGHILFFSTEEYLKVGEVSKCKDGMVIDIQNLVK